MKNSSKIATSTIVASTVTGIIDAMIIFISVWFGRPAMTIQAWGVKWILLAILSLNFIIFLCVWDSAEYNRKGKGVAATVFGIAAAGVIIVMIIDIVVSGSMLHAKKYSQLLKVEEGSEKDIPSSTDLNRLFLTDTKSANKLSERVLGGNSEYASQYKIGRATQIVYKGETVKVAPLAYDGFFKWNANKEHGIPAYIIIRNDNEGKPYAELKELGKGRGMKFVPSAAFGQKLARHLYREYPSYILQSSHFEIDEDGNPYYITPYLQATVGISGGKKVAGCIITDPATGKTKDYKVGDVPAWVDLVVDGDTVSRLYNYYGSLRNGFWNAHFAKKGCVKTTNDFGYVSDNTDIWSYTGVTSVTGDSSNLGFVLANERTGEVRYIKQDGADEHSAMGAAEGEVQEKGYKASFPSLILVDGQPTYVMVLKDKNLLTKSYVCVNVARYDQVAVAATPEACFDAYRKLIGGEISADEAIDTSEQVKETEISDTSKYQKKEIKISHLKDIVENGNTYAYLEDEDGNIYKAKYADVIRLMDISEGEKLTIYTDGKNFTLENPSVSK